MGIRTTTSNGRHPIVGFNDVSISGDDEGVFRVSDNEQSLQPPENPICSPIFGQLHGCPEKIPAELVQLFFKLSKKGKGICRGPCKTSKNFIMVNPSNLPGSMLHDGMFKRHLTIPCHHH